MEIAILILGSLQVLFGFLQLAYTIWRDRRAQG